MSQSQKLILQNLIQKGVIDQTKADQIEVETLKNNISIIDYLLKHTDINKTKVLEAFSSVYKVPYLEISSLSLDSEALGLIPESVAKKYNLIPFSFDRKTDTITIGTNNPFDISIVDFLEKKTGKKIILAFVQSDDVKKAIDIAYSQGLTPEVKEALKEVGYAELKKSFQPTETSVKEAPISKIVSTILEFAFKSRASDIHIEPQETSTRVRYRIDGILHEKLSLPRDIHDSLISRIKILSQMKIDEKRIPQDGRFEFEMGNDQVDLRVSTLPTVHGEKVVIRLLKKTGGLPTLSELGLRGSPLRDLQEAISRPYGIILVTGPTGSGKTTTLYSLLSILNKPGVNIMTLEDPVEYQIVGINQVQINPQAGLTFANGLRAFLRQDPNIILVGEIRDRETTQLAIQAALTGHLVFSTLHTNDSATAIPRLLDLGGEPFLIASVVNASMAQRIVRKVCEYCKKSYIPADEIQNEIKHVLGDFLPSFYKEGKPIQLTKGEGCSECNGSGYFGRIAIFEVLKITSAVNKMILKEGGAKEIEQQAKREGLITMKQDGYLKSIDGITTIEEVLRVAEV